MSNYIVSFTIGQTDIYNVVWNSLKEVVERISIDTAVDETTSFFAFQSSLSTADVIHQLYYESKLLTSSDALVLVNLTQQEHAYAGLEFPNLMASALGTMLVKAID